MPTSVAIRERSEELLAACSFTGSRIIYGTERRIGPVIYGADPDAVIHGRFINTGDPALLEKELRDSRVFWSGAPAVPSAVLRTIARKAGVHLYVDTGDQVLAERGLLSIHASLAGRRTVNLPEPCRLVDASTGAAVTAGASQVEVDMAFGKTATWFVHPAGG